MRRIRTQTKGMKPLDYNSSGNTLAIYTYLTGDSRSSGQGGSEEGSSGPGVEYQVRAHFEWNPHQPDLARDRKDGKHFAIAKRSLERGGRQDIFLGTRECQGYVEAWEFGSGAGDYDNDGELQYGLVFHSFDYPDETGKERLATNFWRPKLKDGVLSFPRPGDTSQILKKDIRAMNPKRFGLSADLLPVELEFEMLEGATGALENDPGVSLMSWIEKLYQTYDRCAGQPQFEQSPLHPISHVEQQAHLEIVLDELGHFLRASIVAKEPTLIPATEKSAGRSSGPAAHPLCDKVKYIARDYEPLPGKEPVHQLYLEQLRAWVSAEPNPKLQAVSLPMSNAARS